MSLTAITKDFITRSGAIIKGTTEVTSSTGQLGALQVDGGAAVAKNLIVGQGAAIHGSMVVYGTLTASGGFVFDGALSLTTATISTLTVDQQLTVTAPATLSSTTTVTGELSVSNTATFTGDTLLNGATTVGSTATFNGTVDLNGAVTVDGESTFNNTATFSAPLVVSGSNTLTVGTGATTLGGSLTVTGVGDFNDTTTATSAGAGSLQVAGGVYVEKNLIVTGTGSAFDTSTWTANALAVDGGAYIKDGLFVEGPTTFSSDVTFNGTATYVYSTNTYFTDNLMDMHVPPGGVDTNWAADDGKDIGLVFHYYKGSDKRGFLGFANDSTYLEWYENGSESEGVFTGTTYGTFKTANIQLVGTENATSTATGALRVVGGVGIGGDLYVGGTINGTVTNSVTATFATNLLGGGTGQIAFQSGDSASAFDADFTYDSATDKLTVKNVAVPGATGSTSSTTGAVVVTGGVGIGENLYVGGTIYGDLTGTATTATNLAGGASGSVPYQTADGVTTFVAIGSEDTVLTSKSGVPTWASAGSTSVGSATTATNIAGGSAGQIAFQTGTGLTGFDADLTFSTSTDTLSVTNAAIAGTTTAGTGTGALTVAGGVYIADNLIVANGATVGGSAVITTSTIDSNAVTSIVAGADISVTGTVGAVTVANTSTLQSVTTRGATTDQAIGISNTTNATSTTTGALTVTGGAGVGGDMYVGGLIYSGGAEVLTTATAPTPTLQSVTTVGATSNQAISFTNTSSSISTTTGALVVTGGVGVGGAITAGNAVTVGGSTGKGVLLDTKRTTFATEEVQILDSFFTSEFRSVRYVAQIVQGNNVHVTELVIFHAGTDVYINEYGTFFNTAELGVFDAIRIQPPGQAYVEVKFTPANSNSMTVTLAKTAITD